MPQGPVSARCTDFERFGLMITKPLQARVQITEILGHRHVVNPGLKLRLEKLDVGIGYIEQGRATEQQVPASAGNETGCVEPTAESALEACTVGCSRDINEISAAKMDELDVNTRKPGATCSDNGRRAARG